MPTVGLRTGSTCSRRRQRPCTSGMHDTLRARRVRSLATVAAWPRAVAAACWAIAPAAAQPSSSARRRRQRPAPPGWRCRWRSTAPVSRPASSTARPGATPAWPCSSFQEARGLPVTGHRPMTRRVRRCRPSPPLVAYTLTAEDMAGPFVERIPDDMMEKRTLEVLAYTSPAEMLAERFHTTPRLLARLNPSLAWKAGAVVQVPNVEPVRRPRRRPRRARSIRPRRRAVADVRVSRSAGALVVRGADGVVLFSAPVTSGSEHDPLPLGTWKVTAVYLRPVFHYNPDLFWDADPSHAKARLPAGPQQPGRRRLDRSGQGALRPARDARARDGSACRSRTAACASPTGTRCASRRSCGPGTPGPLRAVRRDARGLGAVDGRPRRRARRSPCVGIVVFMVRVHRGGGWDRTERAAASAPRCRRSDGPA